MGGGSRRVRLRAVLFERRIQSHKAWRHCELVGRAAFLGAVTSCGFVDHEPAGRLNSYLWFSAGFSLVVYAAFVWWTDLKGKQLQLFRVFGLNPLAGYILHGLIAAAVRPFAPKDSPLPWVVFAFLVYFGILWLFLWGLDRQRNYIRL